MVKINYIEANGARHTLDVTDGNSVMEGVLQNNLPGVLAECGGACACGTCQVVIPDEWQAKIEPAGALELSMLDSMESEIPNRRLSCQVLVKPEYEGLVVQLLAEQKL